MSRCKTCKHWLSDLDGHVDKPTIKGVGRCLAVIENDRYGDYENLAEAEKAAMIVMDGSNYFAALFTKPDHGCLEWQANEKTLSTKN